MWRAYFSSAVVQARGAESALQLGPHIPPHKKKHSGWQWVGETKVGKHSSQM